MSNVFPIKPGFVATSGIVPSGSALIGQLREDDDGSIKRFCFNATTANLNHGDVLVDKEQAAMAPGYVKVCDTANKAKQVVGVAQANLDGNRLIAQGETFWATVSGPCEARISTASIVAGDMLTATSSGTLGELAAASGEGLLARARETQAYTDGTTPSGCDVTLFGLL